MPTEEKGKANLVNESLSKIDATYIELRERILFGELAAGAPMYAEDIMRYTGVSLSMARQLLLSLGAGGYLKKSGRSYVVSTFTKEQVEEWRLALCAIVEIGALKLALTGAEKIDETAAFLNAHVRGIDVRNERFFIGAMALTTFVLGGPRSTLSRLVEQFIPQAFFRLLWIADSYADRTGFLVEAGDRFLSAARSGDLEGIRQSVRFFFDGTAPSLYTLIDNMAGGSFPANEKTDGFQTIELQISGVPTYAGSSRSSTPILRPISDAGKLAFAL